MSNCGRKLQKTFPFEIKNADETILEKYPEINDVFVGPKNYCFDRPYEAFGEKFYNFEARPDDVWVLGYPRSGTTVLSEIVWLLSNDLDYKRASETVLDVRFPVLENAAYFQDHYNRISTKINSYNGATAKVAEELTKPAWETLPKIPGKRFIKTHVPLSLGPSNMLTSGCKVIYVARNPKDVCVSIYLFFKSLKTDFGSFDKFWNYFRNGLVIFTPYFEHLKEALAARSNQNFMFLLYEDYIRDPRKTVRALAKFLDKEINDGDLDKLLEHVKIDNFRKNKSVNNDHLRDLGVLEDKNDSFIRKGVVGGWRDYFQGAKLVEADGWIKENLSDYDLTFL